MTIVGIGAPKTIPLMMTIAAATIEAAGIARG
jgi:hypothetical protein